MVNEISLEEYKKAYREIVMEEEEGFITHLVIYVFVNILLIVINVIYSPNVVWFFYPLIGWEIGIFLNYLFGIRWKKKELLK
ncbi:MAG: 2TM domain-containing protein, partial [Nitrososphaerales archaeon]